MAIQTNHCKLCSKRILAHGKRTKCSICYHSWHKSCLPNFTEDDYQYSSTEANIWSCPHCLLDIFPYNGIENNNEFTQATKSPNTLTMDIEALNAMAYDPFDDNDDDGEGIFNDIDPDQNFLWDIRGKTIKN
jgi:hypothetical protein